ncbi:DUF6603 domain-containing protein [Streptomyces lunalinharesii]|uniref:DUF6603 domain-containing protein n=1 Tax=Streptomyces lunalinharesii TaxID=333384 RepID=A0ABN3T2X1_9ACTN
MALSADLLRTMFSPEVLQHQSGSVRIGSDFLTLSSAKDLLTTWFPAQELRIDQAQCDPEALEVIGSITLKDRTARPGHVRFLTEVGGEVTGLRITVSVPVQQAADWLPQSVRAAFQVLHSAKAVAGVRLVVGIDIPPGGDRLALCEGFGVELAVEGATPAPYLWGYLPAKGGMWALTGTFPPITLSLAKLATLTGGVGLPLPDPVKGAAVCLTGAAVTFTSGSGRGAGTLQSCWLRVGVEQNWTLVPDVLTVRGLSAEFSVIADPGTGALSRDSRVLAVIGGVLDLAGVRLAVQLSRNGPEYRLSGDLDQPVDIGPLLAKLFTAEQSPVASLLVRRFGMHGAFGGGTPSYGLDAELARWPITDWLTLSRVRLSVSKAGAHVTASFDADWEVKKLSVALHGEWTKSAGWWFTAHLAPTARADVLSALGLSLPGCLSELKLTYLGCGIGEKKSGGEAQLSVLGAIPGLGMTFALQVNVDKALLSGDGVSTRAAYRIEGRATLSVENRVIECAVKGDGDTLTGTWTNTSGIAPAEFLKALKLPVSGLPLDLLPVLTSLTVSQGKAGHWLVHATTDKGHALTAAGGRQWWLVQLRISCAARLSDLELLRGQLPAGQDVGIAAPTLRYTKGKITKETVAAWRAWYGADKADALGFPEGDVPAGASGAVRVLIGAQWQEVPLRSGGAPKSLQMPPSQVQAVQTPSHPPAHTPPPAQPAELSAELRLDRSIGPLRLRGLGIRLSADKITVSVNGLLTIAGVELEAEGLGVGVGLAAPHTVTPALRGLMLSVKAGPAEVAGALLYSKPPPPTGFTDQFDGMLLLRLPTVSGKLLGQLAYKSGGGAWSFSVFGELAAEGGGGFGPPPFRVTGAMLGGGYNATVRVPGPHEVQDFPLVAGLGNPALRGQSPAEMAKDLFAKKWLSPRTGQNWVAVGVQFTSFEFLAGRALALVEFGDDLSVGLFALLRATFPSRLKTGDAVYAQIEIAMRALYQRGPGLLSFTALLTDNSYVLNPSFKLTGGLAVYVWSPPEPGKGPDRSGDFVITLGGYHPLYHPPAHYPRVPRLGASWALSGAVSITSAVYLAVTPGSLMLGSNTAIVFDGGWVRAWFVARFDGYLQWTNPPKYDFRIGVRIGFAADISIGLIHFTVRAEVAADCHVWGDPFGGRATVHAGPVSFTVAFGSAEAKGRAVAWADFQRQLPPPLKASVVGGLLAAPRTPGVATQPWTVATDGFSFTTTGVAPATSLLIGRPCGTTEEIKSTSDKVAIRPLKATGVTSTHTVTVSRGGTVLDLKRDGWSILPDTGAVPEALWGRPDQPSGHLLTGRLVGLRLTAPVRKPSRSPGTVTPQALRHETVPNTAKVPLTPLVDGAKPTRETGAVGKVAAISGAPATTARDSVLAALKKAGAEVLARDETKLHTAPPVPLRNSPLSRYGRDVESAFTDAPLTVTES